MTVTIYSNYLSIFSNLVQLILWCTAVAGLTKVSQFNIHIIRMMWSMYLIETENG